MKHWNNVRVLILGAARQGMALARWLARHEADVTLSDSRPAEQMSAAREALSDSNVRWTLGGHPLELLDQTDVLCLSGGVPTSLPIVQEAIRRGIPLSNDTQVFMEVVPCKTIGITGSAGKTTTTTLVGEMAKKVTQNSDSRIRKSYVGGNIGDPLINYADEMTADDLAILEISSFQLEQMTVSPNVAAILNVTPNHLDRHGTMEAYTAAKARILDFQTPADTAVLGRDDPGAWNLRGRVKGRLLAFSLRELEEEMSGAYYQDGLLSLREGDAYFPLLLREKIQLRGDHNVANVLAAFAIGYAAGFTLDSMLEAAEEFRGVPHRLELAREWRGVRWYNDSIATAPERSMAAIRSFSEPIVLMLGGRDKNLPWDDLARLIQQRVKHVVIFGEAGDLIERAVQPTGVPFSRVQNTRAAVEKAAAVAAAGDVVLFSPGCTSYDEFKDFAERGAAFIEWTRQLS